MTVDALSIVGKLQSGDLVTSVFATEFKVMTDAATAYTKVTPNAPVVGIADIHARPVPGGSDADSSAYKSRAVALAACYHNTDQCGTKMITSLASAVTLTTEKLTNGAANSCHWLIKSSCDAPLISVKQASNRFGVTLVDYQASQSGTMVDTDFLPKTTDLPMYPTAYQNLAMGSLMVKAKKEDATGMCTSAQTVLNELQVYKNHKSTFERIRKTVDPMTTKWNTAVDAIDKELKDEERKIGEKRGPRGQRETSLTALPDPPAKLEPMGKYMGLEITSDLVSYYSGFGVPTE